MYTITIFEKYTDTVIAKTQAQESRDVMRTALVAYQKARNIRTSLVGEDQYIPTHLGFPVGTHYLSIGHQLGRTEEYLETVIVDVAQE